MDWLERAYQCKTTENEIRQWLASHGYNAENAVFHELRLHAAHDATNEKVYRFQVSTNSLMNGSPNGGPAETSACKPPSIAADSIKLYGVCRDDSQHRTEIALYPNATQRDQLLQQWSQGLSRRSSASPCRTDCGRNHCATDLIWFAGALFGLMLVLAFLMQ